MNRIHGFIPVDHTGELTGNILVRVVGIMRMESFVSFTPAKQSTFKVSPNEEFTY